MTRRSVWDDLMGQARPTRFLRSAVASDAVSHAYLFVGPAGVGKKTAARALACALFCDDGGCGTCRACTRVKAGTHPDLHLVAPEGVAGYRIEQVRHIVRDVGMRPIEARLKVYVLDGIERFNRESANAFLKTLEEPPDDVVIVLLAADYDAVLPTIASRCQVVRFNTITPSTAEDVLVEREGVTRDVARQALAASGTVLSRARDFVHSSARREMRETVLDALARLTLMDAQDVLESAKSLLAAAKTPLAQVKAAHDAELAERREFLGDRTSTKAVEERHKRELTAREREGVTEILNVAESWLHDCAALAVGADELVANVDAADETAQIAAVLTPEAAVRGLRAVGEARKRISYNVTPQLALEAMLFDIQEVLRCPR